MIQLISSCKTNPATGNKASQLAYLHSEGFNVPEGIILDSESFAQELARDGRLDSIRQALVSLNETNAAATHEAIQEILEGFTLSESLKIELTVAIARLDAEDYAVRSSASAEDGIEGSFAGIYETNLRVKGMDEIARAIEACYRSLYSKQSLVYLARQHQIKPDSVRMAVIIQEMVEATASGVLFTAHPLKGLDQQMAVELTDGTAEHLVAGEIKPLSIDLPWFGSIPSESLKQLEQLKSGINESDLQNLRQTALAIAERYGYPLDIEFAFDPDHSLHILQARPITSMRYDGIEGMWTTADFKDGGVSATVCRQYMWSLYELAWDHSLNRFLEEGKLADPSTQGTSAQMIFGRPYWNLNIVKNAMRKVPGFKERAFDQDYGISGDYEGDGDTTPVNLKTMTRFIPVLIAQRKLLKTREDNAASLKQELLDRLDAWHRQLDALSTFNTTPSTTIEEAWREIVFSFYLKCESSYFWQIFLNTIHQTLIRDSLLKYMDNTDYLSLLGGLDEVSHLLPFYELWNLSRQLRSDEASTNFWTTLSSDEIEYLSHHPHSRERFDELNRWFERYGYHSEKELDVSWPNFREDKLPIVRQLKEMITWPDELGPEADQARSHDAYNQTIDALRQRHGQHRAKKLEAKIDHMRQLLWWREEFRDISTRAYDLVRRATLLLAEQLTSAGVIQQPEDIWQLKIDNTRRYLDKEITATELQTVIGRNRIYYNAYRNFLSANELPPSKGLSNIPLRKTALDSGESFRVSGVVANSGQVRGIARVVRSLDEIDRLQPGDILITRFTDTGWTVKFAILGGIVTEYGGVLSHAAIVSREYGIPAIVSATDAMEQIEDGAEVYLDADTGQVWQKGRESDEN